MASAMYITESQSNGQSGVCTPKFASTNSIPALVEESSLNLRSGSIDIIPQIIREPKARRHSVLDDLRARRDSLFQRARRGSIFEEKENDDDTSVKEKNKDKRRSSDGNRRGSIFYVSNDLLEENLEALANETMLREEEIEMATKKGRRKSWHPLAKPPKLDRKRRKGVASGGLTSEAGSTEGLYNSRQKRLSWWNIFVPDSVGRSKSRSVDHGFTMPYDLDSLRSKVESRFESVDKLSKDSDSESKDGSITTEKKHSRLCQPENTIAYTVGERDTLPSVAARFDTTPSELTKLNRLGSTFVYPGQKLWVPNKGEACPGSGSALSAPSPDPCHDQNWQDDLPIEERELLDTMRPLSPKPGHMERVRTPLNSNAPMDEDEPAYRERFLKINVRHITDGQGVVGGVLLVTPNAVMFDPNVSDPLVIEHGAESYGVIAPMEFVVNAAIYYDIAHMRVSHTDANNTDKKAEIYYMKKPSVSDKSLSPGKDEHFNELVVDDNESVCSCPEREGDAFPKAFDRELIAPTNLQNEEASASTKDKNKNDENESSGKDSSGGGGQASRTLEERRRSMLDHHWAVPSKDRMSFSVDDEQQDSLSSDKADSSKPVAIPEDEDGSLVKQSCYDSGIDIREPNLPFPVVQPIPSNKVYSDADVVLSSGWVPPMTIVATNVTTTTTTLDTIPAINGRKKASSVSFSLDSNAEEPEKDDEHHKDEDKHETRKNKMLKRLSYPLAWVEGLTGEKEDDRKSVDKNTSLPNSADSHHSSVFGRAFLRRASVGTFIRQHPLTSSGSSSVDSSKESKNSSAPPRLDYRSMVSVEDKPNLFASFDKLLPRPARSCEDPPLYLRLRTGRPKDKKIRHSTPIMSYGKKKLRPEYWYSIPRNRVDDLYRFIHAWVPALYGELDENYWREKGYILSDTDTDLSPELSPRKSGETGESIGEGKGNTDEITELTRESWEVLSMSEELRRALYANSAISLDVDIIPPDLVGTTEILTDDHREHLCRHLPPRAEGYVWTLVFSTSQHGFSLNSMYRKMAKIESPILLVIEDTEGNVFGALTSCSLHTSDHFYGTGESLLFRFTPKFQAFNWTGDNLYFIKGNNDCLAIGAGDGKFGLWLDGDLYQGRTQPCSTYGNEQLAPHEDFVVKTLECWAFI